MEIRACSRSNGLQLLVKAAPLARCLAMMKSGDADIITNLLRTREREDFIRYLEAPYQTHSAKVFYLRSEDPRPVVSYEQLYGLDIGVKRGARYGTRFDEDNKLHKQAVASHVLNFKKLAAGRLDLVISTESEGDYLIREYGWLGQFKKAALRFRCQPMSILVYQNNVVTHSGSDVGESIVATDS